MRANENRLPFWCSLICASTAHMCQTHPFLFFIERDVRSHARAIQLFFVSSFGKAICAIRAVGTLAILASSGLQLAHTGMNLHVYML